MRRDVDAVCERARAWLSAARDAQAGDDPRARAHLEGCGPCARWAATLDEVTRYARVRPGTAPDVLGPALAAWPEHSAAPSTWPDARQTQVGRAVLAGAGLAGLALAALGLLDVFGYAGEAGFHLGWELYSFEAALAVGFLLAARSPRRYLGGLLPVALAAVLLTLVPSAGVAASGGADLVREASHVPLLAGVAGLLLLADARHRRRDPRRRGHGDAAVA
jgi:hypothetical protein